MDRREFLRNAGFVATWAGVAVVIHGCGNGDDGGPTGPDLQAGDVAGVIGSNHGHAVKITAAQLAAGGAVTLTLTGGGHSHQVDLTAGQVGQIADGQRVATVSTSTNGHSHGVTFN